MRQRFQVRVVPSARFAALALLALIVLPATASGAERGVSLGRVAAAGSSASWAIGVEAALPANAASTSQNVSINSVSCPSVGNCSAVGTYLDSSGNTQGLLLTETAGSWATGVEAALPANAASTNRFVEVSSVSCASAGNCTAVGTYLDNSINDNGEGLLLTETAGSWAKGVEAVLPGNASSINQNVQLPSVSCASAGNCTAVGGYLDNSNNTGQGLLLTETSGTWSSGVAPALPANAATDQGAFLTSVSCTSAGNCGAVGVYNDNSAVSQGLLLSETAGSWATGTEAPLPANASTTNPGVSITSVSCSSTGNCSAVGYYDDNNTPPKSQGLLLTETAGSWATGVEATLPGNATTTAPGPLYSLGSVSCASAGNCSAVGVYTDNSGNGWGLLLTEKAGVWAAGLEAALPANAITSQQFVSLNSVSCPSVGNCVAVGSYNLGQDQSTGLLLTETAGSWATGVEATLPANGYPTDNVALNSVSCPAVGNCSAVGWYEGNSTGGNQGLLLASPAPVVTLNVSKNGTGSGTVTSAPAGIDCGPTCSHGYTQGTKVTLTATPTAGSEFAGWSNACSGTGTCVVTTNADNTATATFKLVPKPCVVPNVKNKTLTAAESSIKAHACTVGKIKHATSRTVKKNHVISQTPKSGSRLKHGAKVSLAVSKGR